MKHVPHAHELVAMGLAREVMVRTGGKSSTKIYRISEEGNALLRNIMRENALEALAAGKGDWVQPPGQPLPAPAEVEK